MDGAGLGDCLGSDDPDVLIQQVLEIPCIIQLQDGFAVGDRDSIIADGNDGFIRNELYTAIPVFIFDGNGGDDALLGIHQQGLAHAELTAFRDADDRQTKDFYAFFHENSPIDYLRSLPEARPPEAMPLV